MSNNREAARFDESRDDHAGGLFGQDIRDVRDGKAQRGEDVTWISHTPLSSRLSSWQNNQTGRIGENVRIPTSGLLPGARSFMGNSSPTSRPNTETSHIMIFPRQVSESPRQGPESPRRSPSPMRSPRVMTPLVFGVHGRGNNPTNEATLQVHGRGNNFTNETTLQVHGRGNNFTNEATLQRVDRCDNVCICIMWTIEVAATTISCLLAMLFIIALVEGNTLTLLTRALRGCISTDKLSCYSEIMDAFFPLGKILRTPYLSLKIYRSCLANSGSICEFGFPLSIFNPFILLPAFFVTTALAFIMAYFHNRLVKLTKMTADMENNQVLRQRREHSLS